MSDVIMKVSNLSKHFKVGRNKYLLAVDNISFEIRRGETLGVVGESGCGKTTLCARLLKKDLGLTRSVSATTRSPRAGEKRNVDYIFITKEAFRKDIEKNKFLEHAEVFDNYYGTPKKFVLETLKKNKDILLNIDIQGAAQVKKNFKEAVLVFISPPSPEILRERLKKRSISSFLAEKDIELGKKWDDEIRENLMSCNIVLIIFTPNSKDQHWILLESGAAWVLNKTIIPATMNVEFGDILKPISASQGISITTPQGYTDLINKIEKILKKKS